MNETVVEMMARWYNTLNVWEWPDDLPGKDVVGWDSLPQGTCTDDEIIGTTKCTVITQINNMLVGRIGEKECLRWWHIHEIKRTNAEFEEWWADRSGMKHEEFLDKWTGERYPRPNRVTS